MQSLKVATRQDAWGARLSRVSSRLIRRPLATVSPTPPATYIWHHTALHHICVCPRLHTSHSHQSADSSLSHHTFALCTLYISDAAVLADHSHLRPTEVQRSRCSRRKCTDHGSLERRRLHHVRRCADTQAIQRLPQLIRRETESTAVRECWRPQRWRG